MFERLSIIRIQSFRYQCSFKSYLFIVIQLKNYSILVLHQNAFGIIIFKAFCKTLYYINNFNKQKCCPQFECRATKAQAIFSSGGLDPGTALACNYFYGYLNIMLPASGGTERTGKIFYINYITAQ